MYKFARLNILRFLSYLDKYIHFSSKNNIILCYHSISDDDWKFSTSRQNFNQQLSVLLNCRKVVSLDKIVTAKQNKLAAITFDDGYENVYINAYPILKKNGLVAAVFINELDKQNNKKVLSTAQIKKLVKEGWTIGYHTQTHIDCTKVIDKELENNLQSKNIEKKIKYKIRHFAYPYGKQNKKVRRAVAKKFEYAYLVEGGQVRADDLMQIDRITIPNSVSIHDFRIMLTDIGVIVNHLFEKVLFIYLSYV